MDPFVPRLEFVPQAPKLCTGEEQVNLTARNLDESGESVISGLIQDGHIHLFVGIKLDKVALSRETGRMP
jgi:hypothetical protein